MVLGELYLPLSLRGDEGNIGGHQKKGRGIGELLEMLSPMHCSVAMHKKVLKVILVILCVNS
jgi:hypothetical protein